MGYNCLFDGEIEVIEKFSGKSESALHFGTCLASYASVS
jgi:hypothetical protein